MTFDFSKIAGAVIKAVGENAEQQDVPYFIPSGFVPLDHAIGGAYDRGWPVGRIVEIYGPESSGKTWLATQAMISAQRMGGVAGFEDHERSFKLSLAEKLGLDISPGRWFYKKPNTFEASVANYIKAVRAVRGAGLPMECPIVWTFDSLASMIPNEVWEKLFTEGKAKPGAAAPSGDLGMREMLSLARACSQYFPAITQMAEENNVLVIFLNQIRLQPGVVYGNPEKTPGGNSPKFYSSVRVSLGATRLMKDEGGDKVMAGSEVKARCIKNKVSRPYMAASWRFMFNADGSGRFAVAESMIEFAVAKKLLPVAGPRVEWTDGKTYYKSVLAKKLEDEGRVGELEALIKASGVAPDEEPEQEEELA